MKPTVRPQVIASSACVAPSPSSDLVSSDGTLRLEPVRGGLGVVVSGEIDQWSVALLRAGVAAACRQDSAPCATFTFDIRNVTFLDSAGVHELAVVQGVVARRCWVIQVIPPAAQAPCRLIRFAEDRGWLPRSAAFAGPR